MYRIDYSVRISFPVLLFCLIISWTSAVLAIECTLSISGQHFFELNNGSKLSVICKINLVTNN